MMVVDKQATKDARAKQNATVKLMAKVFGDAHIHGVQAWHGERVPSATRASFRKDAVRAKGKAARRARRRNRP